MDSITVPFSNIIKYFVLVAVIATVIILSLFLSIDAELSGWVLFTITFILIFLYMRKRLSTLPLGRVYVWVQSHAGLSVVAVFILFFVHMGRLWPSGTIEMGLYLAYLFTALTGGILIVLNRILPASWRLDFGKSRASMGSLWNERNELSLRLEELGEKMMANVETSSFVPAVNHMRELLLSQYTLGVLMIPGLKRESQKLQALTVGFSSLPDNQMLASINAISAQVQSCNQQMIKQLQLKFLLSIHVAAAFLTALLVVAHIVIVYAYRT